MANIKSNIGSVPYRIELKSPTGNVVIADEPVDKGGQDAGFSPKELLISALAACTSATLRMYADHKKWELTAVEISIDLQEGEVANTTAINREITVSGNLTDEQKKRLLAVANACPIHKILSNPIELHTILS